MDQYLVEKPFIYALPGKISVDDRDVLPSGSP
jgi:hypothetical protein